MQIILMVPEYGMTDIHSRVGSGVPRNFVRGGGFNKFGWGQRERGSGGGSPL